MIRAVTINDVQPIGRLAASLSHFYLKEKTSVMPEWFAATITESEFLNRIKSPEFTNFLYEVEGTVLGYIAMKGNNQLYHLFVSEKHHGNGIARQLWQHATSYCVSTTYTLRSSLFAVPIYKKFGFVETGVVQEKDGICFQPMALIL